MPELTDAEVATLEASWNQQHAACHGLEKQVKDALKDLEAFCAKIGDSQNTNDRALQDLHRELGQIEAAANQQRLTSLLVASDDGRDAGGATKPSAKRTKRSGEQALVPTKDNELHGAVERARSRGNRFNTARISEWVRELDHAIRLGEHAMIERGLAGLKAELAK